MTIDLLNVFHVSNDNGSLSNGVGLGYRNVINLSQTCVGVLVIL